jgi:hypothetical protein
MNYKQILVALGVVLLVAACTTRPIVNITDAPIVTTGGKQLTEDEVRKAIITAGSGLGWVIAPVSPGLATGTLNLRTHLAVVDIRYTTKSFSIIYKDSTNLHYRSGQIHRNYNDWIENLDRDIRNELLRM